jgi:hypothetical protein
MRCAGLQPRGSPRRRRATPTPRSPRASGSGSRRLGPPLPLPRPARADDGSVACVLLLVGSCICLMHVACCMLHLFVACCLLSVEFICCMLRVARPCAAAAGDGSAGGATGRAWAPQRRHHRARLRCAGIPILRAPCVLYCTLGVPCVRPGSAIAVCTPWVPCEILGGAGTPRPFAAS